MILTLSGGFKHTRLLVAGSFLKFEMVNPTLVAVMGDFQRKTFIKSLIVDKLGLAYVKMLTALDG